MAAIATTTPPDGKGVLATRVVAAILLLIGLAVATYAGTWLWHDLALYDLHETARDIRESHPVSNARIAKLLPEIIAYDTKGGLNASDLDDAALTVSVLANRMRANPLAPSLLATAEHLLRERLALAPADGHSWLRLAFIRTERFGMDQTAHDALKMSWFVTPREFAVLWPSLKFRVTHWKDMSPEEQFAAADQVTGLWHKPPERRALQAYLASLPPALRKELLSRIVDPEAAAALTPSEKSGS